jgi:hypothetical protein
MPDQDQIKKRSPSASELTIHDIYVSAILTGILPRDITGKVPTDAVIKVAFEMADDCMRERAKRI